MSALLQLEESGLALELLSGKIVVTPASSITDAQRDYIRTHKTEIIDELKARELPGSSSGADIAPSNEDRLLTEAWTPNGNRMIVEARGEHHAEWIRQMNPKPAPEQKPSLPAISGPIPAIPNPGVRSDVYQLAVRYSIEVMKDTEEQALELLLDLKDREPNFWRQYLREKMGLPETVACSACIYCTDTGANLGRCERGIQGNGASGLHWLTATHPCNFFSPTDTQTGVIQ